MSFELSGTIIPSKFLLVLMQFILEVTTVAHFFRVFGSDLVASVQGKLHRSGEL